MEIPVNDNDPSSPAIRGMNDFIKEVMMRKGSGLVDFIKDPETLDLTIKLTIGKKVLRFTEKPKPHKDEEVYWWGNFCDPNNLQDLIEKSTEEIFEVSMEGAILETVEQVSHFVTEVLVALGMHDIYCVETDEDAVVLCTFQDDAEVVSFPVLQQPLLPKDIVDQIKEILAIDDLPSLTVEECERQRQFAVFKNCLTNLADELGIKLSSYPGEETGIIVPTRDGVGIVFSSLTREEWGVASSEIPAFSALEYQEFTDYQNVLALKALLKQKTEIEPPKLLPNFSLPPGVQEHRLLFEDFKLELAAHFPVSENDWAEHDGVLVVRNKSAKKVLVFSEKFFSPRQQEAINVAIERSGADIELIDFSAYKSVEDVRWLVQVKLGRLSALTELNFSPTPPLPASRPD